MLTVIIGGSGSGKSAFGEECLSACKQENRYYLATMQVYDEEAKRKVDRHRSLREGKGFLTIECPTDLDQVRIETEKKNSACLLECMSNLVANEMFAEDGTREDEAVIAKVLADVEVLQKQFEEVIIITNNTHEEGSEYDKSTRVYVRTLGRINEQLCAKADKAYEVVVGIPVALK